MMIKLRAASMLTACAMLLTAAAVVPETIGVPVSAEETYTEGTYDLLTYQNYGEYIVITDCTAPANGSAFEVEVPAEIDGVPVTTIGESAFSHQKQLISVTLPDSVTSIETKAFQASLVWSVTLSKQLTSIGAAAFNKCTSLHTLELPDTLTSIGEAAFSYSGLTSITIPDSITVIPNRAFVGSTLETVVLPETLTTIEETAFSATQLTSLKIPDNVSTLGAGVFYNCTALIDVELPAGLTVIPSSLFSDCPNLTTVSIPASVTKIQSSVFRGCTALANVYFAGTEEEWSTIDIGNYNESLSTASIHYNSTPEPTVALGNLNGDSAVNANDAAVLLTAAARVGSGAESGLTAEQETAADLNGDGAFDASDAALILTYAAYVGTGGTLSVEDYLAQL